jgi:uncharacterized protein (DUF1501 family)
MSTPLSRRHFLGQASCAALGSAGILSTLLNLRLTSALSAQSLPPGNDYKALVCVFFSGGIDSFNVLVPRAGADYTAYATSRGNLALTSSSLLPISPLNYTAKSLGLHPGLRDFQPRDADGNALGAPLPGLHSLFGSGQAAFVSNVGTLLRPTTRTDYNAGTHLPLGLFSHSDQIEQWQTAVTDTRALEGWAGRMADLLQSSANADQRIGMNITLNGTNLFQSGRDTTQYAVYPSGVQSLAKYEGDRSQVGFAVDSQLSLANANLLEQTLRTRTRDAIGAYQLFLNATTVPDADGNRLPIPLPAGSYFPNTSANFLAAQLEMVARAIAGRQTLGHRRQVFFVEYGGWDHHDEVINAQAAMLPIVSEAIAGFYRTLNLLGVQNDVTLFSASDFGRTLSSNGNGSDHAWAGNQFVVGGAVRGKRIYGRAAAGQSAAGGFYPDLSLGSSLDVDPAGYSRGRLIPTLAVDEYFAELALWFGVSRADLGLVLPNASTFIPAGATTAPVGFLLGT